MRIALIQLDIQWMDTCSNIARASKIMHQVDDADIYILPEMWATGFCTSPTLSTQEATTEALQWMKHEAMERKAALVGSLPFREWSKEAVPDTPALWRNRLFFVHPNGKMEYYDKQHLFVYGGEQLTYSAGKERKVIEYMGLRFLLQTCFDLRFPESARNFAAAPYDVVLYVASWPQSRRAAWDALLRARAIENQSLCIGVNRTGTDPQCIYNGGTSVYDAWGNALFVADSKEQAHFIQVNIDSQRKFRQSFPVLL